MCFKCFSCFQCSLANTILTKHQFEEKFHFVQAVCAFVVPSFADVTMYYDVLFKKQLKTFLFRAAYPVSC